MSESLTPRQHLGLTLFIVATPAVDEIVFNISYSLHFLDGSWHCTAFRLAPVYSISCEVSVQDLFFLEGDGHLSLIILKTYFFFI